MHPHHEAAIAWGESLDPQSSFYFCRLSQLSLLRLLTNSSAMGTDVATQTGAWHIHDLFYENGRTFFADEPRNVEGVLRNLTKKRESSTKEWADAYLTAFAELAGLQLVTFDKALAAKTKGAILLKAP